MKLLNSTSSPQKSLHGARLPQASHGVIHRSLCTALSLAMAFFCVPVGVFTMPRIAFADDANYAQVSYMKQGESDPVVCEDTFTSIDAVMSKAESLSGDSSVTEVIITLKRDWNTNDYERLIIDDGKNYTFNLDGYMINRDESDYTYYGSGCGEVFLVKGGSTLTVNGGTSEEALSRSHGGYLVTDKKGGQLWQDSESNNSYPITGGLITGCACDDKGGAGGIAVQGSGTKLYLNDVTIAGNVSDCYWGDYGHGGAVTLFGTNETFEASNTKMIYNHAEGWGGGIYIDENDTNVTLKNGTEVSHNSTVEYGGGIAVDDTDVTIKLDNASVDNNRAEKNGGGIYHNATNGSVSLSNSSSVSQNYSGDRGGGLYSYYNGTLFTLESGSRFDNNTSENDGGGMYLDDDSTVVISGTAKDGTASAVSNNTSNTGDGGGFYINDNDTSISVSEKGEISGNKTPDGEGAGLYINDNDVSLTLSSGAKLNNNVAEEEGGAIHLEGQNFALKADNSSIDGNEAENGGAFFCDDDDRDVTITLDNNATMNSNKASKMGGALYAEDLDSVSITSSDNSGIISNNSAGNEGGALYFDDTDDGVFIQGVTMRENSAPTGGALWFDGDMTLRNVTIKNNKASEQGAGIYCEDNDDVYLDDKVVIDENTRTSDNVRNNLVLMDGAEIKSNEGHTLTTESHIGITDPENSDRSRRLSYDENIAGNIHNRIQRYIFSDVANYYIYAANVSGMGWYALYIVQGSQKYYLTCLYNGSAQVDEVTQDSTVVLKSSDYPKTVKVDGLEVACNLAYWTLESNGNSLKVDVDSNGEATFNMPANDVVAEPHYQDTVTAVQISLNEQDSWADIATSDEVVKKVLVSQATLLSAQGNTFQLKKAQINRGIRVDSRTVENITDAQGAVAQKKIKYKLQLSKNICDELDLLCNAKTLKDGVVGINTSFGLGAAAIKSISFDESGMAEFEATAVFDVPPVNYFTVTANSVNINDDSTLDTQRQTIEEGEDVTLAPQSIDGMRFVEWRDLPDGATEDPNTHKVTIAGVGSDIAVTAVYKPLVSKIEVKMAQPTVGRTLADTLAMCKMTDVKERDVTSAANDTLSIAWKKVTYQPSSGKTTETDVAPEDVAEKDSTYKAVITFSAPTSSNYSYGFEENLAATVNGSDASAVGYDAEQDKVTITCTFDTGADDRYAYTVTTFPVQEIVDARNYESSLKDWVEYALKNGTTEIAKINWGEPSSSVEDEPEHFAVAGTFEDKYGVSHEVTQEFSLTEVEAPSFNVSSGTYTGSVKVTVKVPEGANCVVYSISKDSEEAAAEETCIKDTEIEITATAVLSAYALYGTSRQSKAVSAYYSISSVRSISIDGGTATVDGVQVSKVEPGTTVTVTKGDTPDGMRFVGWKGIAGSASVPFADPTAEVTTFVMPNADVKIGPAYTAKEKKESNLAVEKTSYELMTDTASFPISYSTDNEETPVAFSTSDQKVVKADGSGNVTVKGAGKATIIVSQASSSFYNGASVEISVNVKSYSSLMPLQSSYDVSVGDDPFKIGYTTENTDSSVTFVSSNPAAAEVDANGNVTIKSVGTTTITLAQEGSDSYAGDSVDVVVTVSGYPNLKPEQSAYTVDLGDGSFKIGYTTDNPGSPVAFSTNVSTVADVDADGNVTVKGAGVATITLTQTASGLYKAQTAQVLITVRAPSNLQAKKTAYEAVAGDAAFKIGYTTNNDESPVTFASSDTKVAEVDAQGNVTAKGAGTATITLSQEQSASFMAASVQVALTVKAHSNLKPEQSAYGVVVGDGSFNIGYTTDNTEAAVTFASSNPQVAEVDDQGCVTIKAAGTATVTLAQQDAGLYIGETATVDVTVRGQSNLRPEKSSYEVVAGDASFKIGYTSASSAEVTFTSSNPQVAEVDDQGNVTPKTTGTATITLKQAGTATSVGESATVSVTVKNRPGLKPAESAYEVVVGDAAFKIGYATDNDESPVTFASSDNKIAEVDARGNVTAKGAGTATITLKQASNDDYVAASAEVLVKVKARAGLKPDKDAYSTAVGDAAFKIGYTTDNDESPVMFASNNPQVAEVDEQGNVTAKGAGTATITLKQAGTGTFVDATAAVNITVKAQPNLTPAKASYEAIAGDAAFKIGYTTDNDESPVTFTTNDNKIAEVDEQGNVTAKGVGTATITLKQAGTDSFVDATATVDIAVSGLPNLKPGRSAYEAVVGDSAFKISYRTDNTSTPVTFSSSDAKVAEVDADGNVTVNGAGTTTLSLSQEASGLYLAQTVQVNLVVRGYSNLTPEQTVYNATLGGSPFKIAYTTDNDESAVTFSTSDSSVAEVDKEGTVTIKGAGTAVITLAQAGSSVYIGGTAKVKVIVEESAVTPAADNATNVTIGKVAKLKVKATGKKKLKLTWAASAGSRDGVQIRYSVKKNMKKAKTAKVKKANAKAKAIKKLKSGKKYFVQVRAYKVVNGKTYWSGWSKKKAVKVK